MATSATTEEAVRASWVSESLYHKAEFEANSFGPGTCCASIIVDQCAECRLNLLFALCTVCETRTKERRKTLRARIPAFLTLRKIAGTKMSVGFARGPRWRCSHAGPLALDSRTQRAVQSRQAPQRPSHRGTSDALNVTRVTRWAALDPAACSKAHCNKLPLKSLAAGSRCRLPAPHRHRPCKPEGS